MCYFQDKNRGFTMVEIMVVLVVISILCVVSIPFMIRTKLVTNENVVQTDMRTITSAAEIYKSSQSDLTYPPNMAALGQGDIPILDAAIAAGKQHGYVFELISTADGSGYTCTANPIQFGATGNRSFCIDQEGILKEYSDTVTADGNICPATKNLESATPPPPSGMSGRGAKV